MDFAKALNLYIEGQVKQTIADYDLSEVVETVTEEVKDEIEAAVEEADIEGKVQDAVEELDFEYMAQQAFDSLDFVEMAEKEVEEAVTDYDFDTPVREAAAVAIETLRPTVIKAAEDAVAVAVVGWADRLGDIVQRAFFKALEDPTFAAKITEALFEKGAVNG